MSYQKPIKQHHDIISANELRQNNGLFSKIINKHMSKRKYTPRDSRYPKPSYETLLSWLDDESERRADLAKRLQCAEQYIAKNDWKIAKYDEHTAKMTANLPNNKLTAEQRSEAARKAIQARWAKNE